MAEANLRWVRLNSNWEGIEAGVPIGMDTMSARSLIDHRHLGEFCEEPEIGELRARYYRDTGKVRINRGRKAGRPTAKKKEVKEKKTDKNEGLRVVDMATK